MAARLLPSSPRTPRSPGSPLAHTPSHTHTPAAPQQPGHPPAAAVETVEVATDGSTGVTGVGGWGWVSRTGRVGCGSTPASLPRVPLSSELAAIDDALHTLPDSRLVVWVDSKDVLRILNWHREPPTGVASLVAQVRRSVSQRQSRGGSVEFRFVRGHSGDRLNEAADALAVAARRANESLTVAAFDALATLRHQVGEQWCAAGSPQAA